jgi:hypothetical protein
MERRERKLTYRIERIPWVYALLFALIFYVTSLLFVVLVYNRGQLSFNLSPMEFVAQFIASMTVVVWLVIFYYYFLRREVMVHAHGVTLCEGRQSYEILWKDISELKMRSDLFPVIAVKNNNGKVFKFNSFLERSEYVLESLRRARPELVNEPVYVRYFAAAIAEDHSWARFFSKLLNYKKIIFKYFLTNLVLTYPMVMPFERHAAFDFWLRYVGVFLSLLWMSVFINLILVSGFELYLKKQTMDKLKLSLEHRVRDMKKESQVYTLCEALAWGLYLLTAYIVYVLIKN